MKRVEQSGNGRAEDKSAEDDKVERQVSNKIRANDN